VQAVTVTVTNTAPACDAPSDVNTHWRSSVSGTASCSDGDSDALTYTVTEGPAHGSLSSFDADTGAWTYTPAGDYVGPVTFSYTAGDGIDSAKAVTQTIQLTDAQAPSCLPQPTTPWKATAGQPVTLTATCTDPDGDPITPRLVDPPRHGCLSRATVNGDKVSVRYTARYDYAGPDAFTFKVTDGNLSSPVYTVKLSVNRGQGW
jgi:hypothetical protein